MNLYQQLEHLCTEVPDKTAIHYEGSNTSYAQLLELVQTCVRYLHHECGVAHGDRVAILSENTPEMFSLLFAAAKLGVIMAPLNWRLSPEELEYAINDADPLVLLHSDQYAKLADSITLNSNVLHTLNWNQIQANTVQDLPEQSAEPDDNVLLVYTSGTTGRPKGAVLAQKALQTSAAMSRDAFSLNQHDVILCALPVFHVGGLNIQALPGLIHGATLVLHAAFNPSDVVNAISQHKVTQFLVVPTILAALINQEQWTLSTLSTLRCLGIGSMDVPVEQIKLMQQLNVPVVQIYGATETGPVAIHQTIDNAMSTIGSIGQCGNHCKIRLLDKNQQDVAMGDSGEIAVKGANVFNEYWNNPSATSDSFADGWFKTGDVARKDANGQYWFSDRLKNVIISGGENIYAAEVERVLSTADGVLEVSVIGIPDDTWGEVVVAAVVLSETKAATTESLQKHCVEKLAKFKQPKQYYALDALPRNALGKIQSEDLRKLITSKQSTLLG